MTNTSSWQAAAAANSAVKMSLTENGIPTAKKTNGQDKKVYASLKKVVTPRRYSFDDNGGGYQGL